MLIIVLETLRPKSTQEWEHKSTQFDMMTSKHSQWGNGFGQTGTTQVDWRQQESK